MDLGGVRLIEIELFSYCNRNCSWCPNSSIDRKNNPQYLSEKTYIKILNELKQENFKGVISFSRYNEPLSNAQLLKKRAHQAKEILPEVKLVSNTNGDYVSAPSLDKLEIDELSIMDYDCKGMDHAKGVFSFLNIRIIKEDYPFLYGEYSNYMKVLYYIDWPKHHLRTYRGGNLSTQGDNKLIKMGKRTAACMEPTYFIGIDYTGDVMPCCELRGDSELQKPFILGNVNGDTLKNIFYSRFARKFRRVTSEGTMIGPCTYCQKCPGRYTRDDDGLDYKEGFICEK